MLRPVSLVPATLAVGFLALSGLTRTDAQTAVPAASTHRRGSPATQRVFGLPVLSGRRVGAVDGEDLAGDRAAISFRGEED